MSNGPERSDVTRPLDELHPNERLKYESNYLRGTIEDSLADPITGALADDDTQLTKFHGFYQQDERDLRNERRKQKLEPAYQMMIRLRLPGGVCTPDQWRQLDELAHTHADGALRLTTRQTFQFHGVLKHNLKGAMQGINNALLDTLAACGDDNRTTMATVNPTNAGIYPEVQRHAKAVSDHLVPRTAAYREIWLDGERVDSDADPEPLYGPSYLPRKFKIGFAVPPTNDIDVYSQDIGFIAMVEDGELQGYNVAIGGGMGRTDNEPQTFPRLADVIGFCRPDQVVPVAEAILTTQRDYGDRVDRKHARMKYTVDDHGPAWFRGEVEHRMGESLDEARDFHFEHNGDAYGWVQGDDGSWHYTLFIENGRIRDWHDYPLMTALREIAKIHDGDFRLTPNQNLIIANVAADNRSKVDELLAQYGVMDPAKVSALRRNSMACVAFPTCGMAMAESERYLPSLLTKLEGIMSEAGLEDDPIIVRMTGCNNGCARPYIAEIGFSGRAPGKYNLYLGGGFHGQRLNKPYLYNVGEERILKELKPIIHHYATDRQDGEPFGDFVIRAGYIDETRAGREFYD